jgi:hypothetical protein
MTVFTTFFVVNNMLLTTRDDTLQHVTTRYNITTLQHYHTLVLHSTKELRTAGKESDSELYL